MGDQVSTDLHPKKHSASNATSLADLQDRINGATDDALSTLDRAGSWSVQNGQAFLNSFSSPERREELLARLKAFVTANPKLSAFLGINFALTGIPLGLFVLYSVSVFVFSLIVGLLIGLLGAISFTILAVGAALLVILPTVFFTTTSAFFLFFVGLCGYYILGWTNRGLQRGSAQPSGGDTKGLSVHRITSEDGDKTIQDITLEKS